MRGEVDRPEQRAQNWLEDRKRSVHGTDLVVHDRVAAFRRLPRRCRPSAMP
jgi:hypothetical protein